MTGILAFDARWCDDERVIGIGDIGGQWWVRWGIVLVLLFASAMTSASVVIEAEDLPRIPLFVARGATVDWTITVRNDSEDIVPLVTLRAVTPILPRPPRWQFGAPATPQCGAVRVVFVAQGPLQHQVWELDVVDLAPGQRLQCTYPLHRPEDLGVDMLMLWFVASPEPPPGAAWSSATWVVGTPTRLTMTATPTCDGGPPPGTRHIRLALHNGGPTGIRAQRPGSCVHFFSWIRHRRGH